MMWSFKLLLFVVLANSSWGLTVTDGVYFFFVGDAHSDNVKTTLNHNFSTLINTKYFNVSKPTVLFTHGFLNSYSSPCVLAVVDAYLTRKDHNIIIIDWSKFTMNPLYPQVAASVNDVSIFVVSVLVQMQTAGVDLKTFHLVGHSLGAQISGRVGYNFLKSKNFQITRITGLDPAGPGFANINDPSVFVPGFPTLNRLNAQFVDIIHSDAAEFGSPYSTGHKDFWPNGGILQPACLPLDCVILGQDDCIECNHARSWKYYAESVKSQNPTAFTGKSCSPGALAYINVFCPGPFTSPMGFYANQSPAIGNFYVQTKDRTLYSL